MHLQLWSVKSFIVMVTIVIVEDVNAAIMRLSDTNVARGVLLGSLAGSPNSIDSILGLIINPKRTVVLQNEEKRQIRYIRHEPESTAHACVAANGAQRSTIISVNVVVKLVRKRFIRSVVDADPTTTKPIC